MELKTNYAKRLEQRHKVLCSKFLELQKEVSNTRAITILALKYKMTIPGIRWILAKNGLIKIKYSKHRVIALAKTFCVEEIENNLYCLSSILDGMPDKATIDDIEAIVAKDLDINCPNGYCSRWTSHGQSVYHDFEKLKGELLK